MNRRSGYTKKWNIFARELEDILALRRIRLERLHEEVAIFPDKVRRLARSLYEPESFPVLNQEEIANLARACQFTDAELLRLKTALLATSVEEMLMACLGQEEARSAAEATLPFILSALQRIDAEAGDTDTKERGDIFLGLDSTNDQALNAAWHAFDCGEMALHLSMNATAKKDRVSNARQACQFFEQALKHLDAAEDPLRTTQGWRDWYTEIQNRLLVARKHLQVCSRG